MSKLSALFALFRKGSEVADVEKWKSRQITSNTIVMFLAAVAGVAKAFGADLHLDDGDIALLAGGLLGAVNIILTVTTSKRAGLPQRVPPVTGPDFPAIDVPSAAPLGGPSGSSSEG